MLLYAVIRYLRLHGRVKASLSIRNQIWICDDIKTPFILGIVKPRIYFPSDMNELQQFHVIAHESAHLKRPDHWWKPLGWGKYLNQQPGLCQSGLFWFISKSVGCSEQKGAFF